MAIADIRNNVARRSVIILLTPIALVVYMAFGVAMHVSLCLTDIADAWKGPAIRRARK